MAKKAKKLISLLLVLTLCISLLGMAVVAADPITGSGTPEDPYITGGSYGAGTAEDPTVSWTDTEYSDTNAAGNDVSSHSSESTAQGETVTDLPVDGGSDADTHTQTTTVSGSESSSAVSETDGETGEFIAAEGTNEGQLTTTVEDQQTITQVTEEEGLPVDPTLVQTGDDSFGTDPSAQTDLTDLDPEGALQNGDITSDIPEVTAGVDAADTMGQAATNTVTETGDISGLPVAGSEDVVDEQGNIVGTKTTQVSEQANEDGSVTYTITTTTTTTQVAEGEMTPNGDPVSSTVDVGDPEGGVPTQGLPVIPTTDLTSSTGTDEYGNQVVTTVTVLDNGYMIETVITDENGNVESQTKTVTAEKTVTVTTQGKQTTTVTEMTQGLTKTVTTVTQTQQVVVDAPERSVTVELTNNVGEDHGQDTGTATLQPDMSLEPKGDGSIDTTNQLQNLDDFSSKEPKGDYDYQYVGYGLTSTIDAVDNDGNGHLVTQFLMEDKDGEKHYVYCADLDTGAVKGATYSRINVADATYLSDTDKSHISGIANNGYWGTAEGAGSLDQLKASLKAAGYENTGLTDAQIDAITPGQAMTATQGALWNFTNQRNNAMGYNGNVAGEEQVEAPYFYNLGFSYNDGKDELPQGEADIVNGIYGWLIGQTADVDGRTNTEELDALATSASVTVGDKNDDGSYDASIALTLAVIPSTQNDDLVLKVMTSGGEVLKTVRIAGSGDDLERLNANEGGTIQIDGLKLESGETITVSLEGYQGLDAGVYLYQASGKGFSNSQTYVGVSRNTRSVALSADLSISVTEDPGSISVMDALVQGVAETFSGSRSFEKTETRNFNQITTVTTDTLTDETVEKWSYSWREVNDNIPTGDDDIVPPGDDDVVPPGDDDVVPPGDDDIVPPGDDDIVPPGDDDIVPPGDDDITIIVELDDPGVPLDDLTEVVEEEVPLAELPEEEVPLAELPDEEVPLGEIPETGDATLLWAAMALLSGGGLAGLGFTGKKRKTEEEI